VNDGFGPSFYRIQQGLSFAALLVVMAIAWWFLVATQTAMTDMSGDGLAAKLMALMMAPAAAPAYLAGAACMWIVMMVAMMIPATLPMVKVFRGMRRGPHPEFHSLLFVGGYLLAWSAFSLLAAGLQWALHMRGSLSGDLLELAPGAAATLLIVAGLYQLTPFKEACLSHCRSPLGFFMQHWRDGSAGATSMGLRHGLYCVGCCWMLMLLMFAGGAMSVAVMAGLSAFILAERILPVGPWVTRLPGVALLLLGAGVALSA
jgi:predicted metal-binding membrane protein